MWAFWHSALEDPEGLCRLVRDTPVTVRSWDRQKRVLSHAPKQMSLELGFALLFLNRTNRSGIVSGGIIGGRDQTGKWKIDARYNAQELCRRIEKIARYRSRIQLYNLDAAEFLVGAARSVRTRSLIYLDPPYFRAGRRLYRDHYTEAGHATLAKLVQRLPWPWVVSYDDTPAVRRLYSERRSTRYDLAYSAQERRHGAEVMFVRDELSLPNASPRANHRR